MNAAAWPTPEQIAARHGLELGGWVRSSWYGELGRAPFAVVYRLDNPFEWRDGAIWRWRLVRRLPERGEQTLAEGTGDYSDAERATEAVRAVVGPEIFIRQPESVASSD